MWPPLLFFRRKEGYLYSEFFKWVMIMWLSGRYRLKEWNLKFHIWSSFMDKLVTVFCEIKGLVVFCSFICDLEGSKSEP